ncbi:MAG: biotin--[acetyl-CoA-carboxylase] ligase [Desulfomonilaceae bacterium]
MFKPNLIILEQAESTQDVAKTMAFDGASSGSAVMALHQVRGRGRSGAQWFAPQGKNLSISVVLRPSIEVCRSPLIGMLASISVAEILDNLCHPLKAFLKWPNDVLVQDKKIAGILSEARIVDTSLEFVILGVGINVNSSIVDFPDELRDFLTSCFILTGKTFDLKEVGNRFLQTLGRLFNKLEADGTSFIPSCWESKWLHKGHKLVRDGVKGIATGIDSDGSLLLKLPDGKMLKISSGPLFTE